MGRPIGDMKVTARRGDGAEAAPDETGELFVTGSLLMQCYLDEPGITAKTLTGHGLKTGDFGRVDESGAVWIAGRKDDIIKRGGEKVSIVHVQQALQGLGRFADVAVLAAPDDILGHVPVAFVVPHDRDGFKASRLLRELRCRAAVHIHAEPADRRGRDPAHRLGQGHPQAARAAAAEDAG